MMDTEKCYETVELCSTRETNTALFLLYFSLKSNKAEGKELIPYRVTFPSLWVNNLSLWF